MLLHTFGIFPKPSLILLRKFGSEGQYVPTWPKPRPEEFQSLDFGKMDLSEYFADITTKANAAIQQDLKNNVQNYYYNLP